MKRRLFAILLAICVFGSIAAHATDLEIVYPNVTFRNAPDGSAVGILNGGEVLTALDETWAGGQLWYHAQSDLLGDGYIAGEFARPIWDDESVFDPESPTHTDYVTENVAAFYTSLYRYLYVYNYCYWNADENICEFRVKNGTGDASIVRSSTKWDIAYMLLRYGLLVENEETTKLRNVDGSSEEKNQVASTALQNHFGTDDIWQILIHSGILNYSEVHAPHGDLSNRDYNKLKEIRALVDNEYRDKKAHYGNEETTEPNLVLYYNPDGGSYYHVNPNCPSTHAKYLPFAGSFAWTEVNNDLYVGLTPCVVCGAPQRLCLSNN